MRPEHWPFAANLLPIHLQRHEMKTVVDDAALPAERLWSHWASQHEAQRADRHAGSSALGARRRGRRCSFALCCRTLLQKTCKEASNPLRRKMLKAEQWTWAERAAAVGEQLARELRLQQRGQCAGDDLGAGNLED